MERITEEALRAEHLKRAPKREIRAERARPGAESARVAYLDVLKLSLCDLAGARTSSVSRTGDTRTADSPLRRSELSEEELALRVSGSDWPVSGLTMVGLERLDDLQACVESVVAERVDGDLIETGVWRGGASILMRATLDSLGADERTVLVADSFRGLPPPDPRFPEDRELDLSRVDFLAVSADEVRRNFARFGLERGVELVEGFFGETLPRLRGRRWAVVRLDGDTYEATWVALESLYPGLSAGGYLIVDDYGLIEECRRAVDDYRREHEISEAIERIDWSGIRWRKAQADGATTASEEAARRPTPTRSDPIPSGPDSGVIVFGSAVTARETYERHAAPGIRRAAEPDSEVLVEESPGSLFQNYNRLLDKAKAHEDLAALVLVHQDAEIVDSTFAATVRAALRDPDVAVVGCVGAVGVRSMAWWRGTLTWAGVTHRYQEYGGGDFPGPTWDPNRLPPQAALGEVDSVDGFVMVLSPWAVRNLRFDESLGALHGYDFDICMQARAAGKKVVTADFRAIHHHSLELVQDAEAWRAAYVRLAEKWADQLPDTDADPERRALDAEADAACATAIAAARGYEAEAMRRQVTRMREELDRTRAELVAAQREARGARSELQDVLTSSSWRLTGPLRALRRRLRRRRA